LTSTSSAAWSVFADLLDPPENPYVRDPAGYVRDVLGEELWSGQVEMVENVVHHDNTVVMAAHSVGKTRALSRLVLWFTRDSLQLLTVCSCRGPISSTSHDGAGRSGS
jgi:hypothetical protein